MIISVEISYYPLSDNYEGAVNKFIEQLYNPAITIEIGKMSSVISGDYDIVMQSLTEAVKMMMEQYASVFNIKISNCCPI